jgi:uncharacterized membrane protein
MLPLESGLFDTIGGLPVHPLVVHAAVMLLPIAAVALIIIFFVPRWRKQYGWLTMIAMAAGVGAAVVAKESGEALAARVGLPEQHQQLASILVPIAVVAFVVSALWFWLQRKADAAQTRSIAARVVGVAAMVLAAAVIVLTVLVGHSGATAAWAGTIAASDTPSAAPATSTPATSTPASSTSASPTPTASATSFSMAQVKQHASASSCWTAIDGKVYDVTSWISQHPGGPARILSLCGTDATSAFHAQHSTQARPNSVLAGFYIGTLG